MATSQPTAYGTAASSTAGPGVVGVSGDKFGSVEVDTKGHPARLSNSAKLFNSTTAIGPNPIGSGYFTEFTIKKAFLYGVASLYVFGCGLASVAELFLDLPCPENGGIAIDFPNPAFDGSACPHTRQPMLLYLTPRECSFGRRLVTSILLGGVIGWERRQADRPAGIRTMSLVSLGSCLFTINSAFAFVGGPMDWDASRISAAIPSGVGFLGAGLIFKKSSNENDTMVVHGLTTAASVWLSAAVGIACGGELYFAASFGTCLMMLLLRFGPRGSDHEDDGDSDTAVSDDDLEGRGEDEESFKASLATDELASPHPQHSARMMVYGDDTAGGSTTLPPGLSLTQRSVGKSETGSITVTGESIENTSLAAAGETTPMLGGMLPSQQSQSQPQLLQTTTTTRSSSRRTTTPTKSNRIRKRQSKANLGSIV